MGIQGSDIGVVFNGVEAIEEMTVNYRYTVWLLSANELSARINGFDLMDVVPMNPLDHQLLSQQKVKVYSTLLVKSLKYSMCACFQHNTI